VQNNSTWAHSPPSRATWPAESFRPIPTLLVALGAIAVFVIVIVAYLLVAVPLHWFNPRQDLPVTQLVVLQSVAYVLLAPYLLVAVPAVSKLSLRQLGIRTPTLGEIGTGVLGAAAMWVVVGAASAGMDALVHRHDTETSIQLLRSVHTPFEKGAFIALALVFAPLVEELVFRIFLFNAFWRYMPMAAAALVSGVLFGSIHAVSAAQLLTIGIPLASGGIVLALVYARTRCYWSNVVTHALFNSVTIVAFFVFGVTS
jgi:membrane protease YdiL (CAAX protease family)